MERIYGLLGRRLGHSYSPFLHAALGNPSYRLIELEPEALGAFLAREDIGGLNVTIPYKMVVMPFCDAISGEAAAIGSVNTLVKRGGRLYGYNTDAHGFAYMAARAGLRFEGKKLLVFGNGGAARTVRFVAKAQGAKEVVCLSRNGADNYENMGRHRDAQILVNATPVGMYPHTEESPVELEGFASCEAVLDLVYNPLRTRLLQAAEGLGIPHAGGLAMLAAQARMAGELFFDRRIEETEDARILRALRRHVENIVLIGMPGCGKNAVGAALGALTGRECVDIDANVERAAKKPIPAIFAEDGEAAFRRMEREKTAEAGKASGKIILTGGGVVKDAENYFPLHANGRIYHVERDVSLLAREGRPLSGDADLEAMYAQRLPLYRAFRDAVVENAARIEDAAEAIWRDFCENTCD